MMGFLDALNIGKQEEVIPLLESKAKSLVENTANKMDRVMLLIELNSGISLDEMLAIRSSDIDYSSNTIAIYNKSIRTVKLPLAVMLEIKQYLGDSNEERVLFPIKQDWVMKRLKAYQNGSNVKLSWRVLRRTYANLARKKGVSPQIIANNIGIPLSTLLQTMPFHESVNGKDIPNVI